MQFLLYLFVESKNKAKLNLNLTIRKKISKKGLKKKKINFENKDIQ